MCYQQGSFLIAVVAVFHGFGTTFDFSIPIVNSKLQVESSLLICPICRTEQVLFIHLAETEETYFFTVNYMVYMRVVPKVMSNNFL